MEGISEIQNFYHSKNVFITGGTGFLGKVLIEKLLRSTDVSNIYLLIRPKKEKDVYRRLEELLECEIFDRIKKEQPKFDHKMKVIPGDCSHSGLGLSITDRQVLTSDVNVIFHVAATVKFDENLKRAFNTNVNGAKNMLELAKHMKNLKALVHVSTLFSNCYLEEIDEVFYKCPHSYDHIGATLEKINEFEADEIFFRIIGRWPNTYTFTKALAENVIKDSAGSLPVGIFRPSVVVSTYKEPISGWTDHMNGPAGVAAAAVSGVMRVIMCGSRDVADLVPVDTCVAGLVATAWDVAQNHQKTSQTIPIYNYVSSAENPIIWREFSEYILVYGQDFPVRNALWSAFMIMTKNPVIYFFLKTFLHLIPGLLVDGGRMIIGKRPKMMKIYKKVHRLSDTISFFLTHTWKVSNDNTVKLWSKLNQRDKDLFPMSMTGVHWLTFFRNYIKGVRKYLLKDPDNTLQEARRKNRM
nr:unnamed protein product [Callosobruchus chinensis]